MIIQKDNKVARRKNREEKTYRYKCTITGEKFKIKGEALNPDDLVSVRAYYELNPEADDRPEAIKQKVLNESGETTLEETDEEELEGE